MGRAGRARQERGLSMLASGWPAQDVGSRTLLQRGRQLVLLPYSPSPWAPGPHLQRVVPKGRHVEASLQGQQREHIQPDVLPVHLVKAVVKLLPGLGVRGVWGVRAKAGCAFLQLPGLPGVGLARGRVDTGESCTPGRGTRCVRARNSTPLRTREDAHTCSALQTGAWTAQAAALAIPGPSLAATSTAVWPCAGLPGPRIAVCGVLLAGEDKHAARGGLGGPTAARHGGDPHRKGL